VTLETWLPDHLVRPPGHPRQLTFARRPVDGLTAALRALPVPAVAMVATPDPGLPVRLEPLGEVAVHVDWGVDDDVDPMVPLPSERDLDAVVAQLEGDPCAVLWAGRSERHGDGATVVEAQLNGAGRDPGVRQALVLARWVSGSPRPADDPIVRHAVRILGRPPRPGTWVDRVT